MNEKKIIILGIFTIVAAATSAIVSCQFGETNGTNEVVNYMSD